MNMVYINKLVVMKELVHTSRPFTVATMTTLVAGLLLVSVLLILAVDIPAMCDYANHLARMHLLVDATTGQANRFYVIQWGFLPNLALDLIVPEISRVTNPETSTKIFLIISQLLVVTGAVALERSVKGRHQFAGLAALLTLNATPFAWGLLNFQFGVGVALWAIVEWTALSERDWRLRLAVHAAFVVALFTSHLFALGIYGSTIGLVELSKKRRPSSFAIMAAPPLVLLAFVPLDPVVGTIDWWFGLKLVWPIVLMNPYCFVLSACLVATLVAALALLNYRGALALTRQGVWVVAGFGALYLIFPRRLFDSAFADVRLLTALMLILPAFLNFETQSKSLRTFAITILAGIVLVNLAFTTRFWLSYQRDYAEIKESFKLISPGSKILVARAGPLDPTASPLYNSPTLAVHYAQAFVPSLYTIAGAQPVRKAISGYEVEDSLDYLPPSISQLESDPPSYARDWENRYDYLYVIGKAEMPLIPILNGTRFTLYRINQAKRPDSGVP
jgi:hypothetical protein